MLQFFSQIYRSAVVVFIFNLVFLTKAVCLETSFSSYRADLVAKSIYEKMASWNVNCTFGADLYSSLIELDQAHGMETEVKDLQYYKRIGLPEKYLDAIAYEYCKISPNVFIAFVFPGAKGKQGYIEEAFEKIGHCFYYKEISLSERGMQNLYQEMLEASPALEKGKFLYYPTQGKVRVFLIESDSHDKVRVAKLAIRDKFGIGNQSLHSTDTLSESRLLGGLVFNQNSLHMLNHRKFKTSSNRPTSVRGRKGKGSRVISLIFNQNFNKYQSWINSSHYPEDWFCLAAGTVLGVYGLRDSSDIDYLHPKCFQGPLKISGISTIDDHTDRVEHLSTDEIIFNPDYHFYFRGCKFYSLEVFKSFKSQPEMIISEKAQRDVRLANTLL